MSKLRHSVTQNEAIQNYKRVLRLVNLYMRLNLDDSTLVTASGGILTWGELRQLIGESLKLRVRRAK